VDDNTVLVGLGTADGIAMGNVLEVTIGNGEKLRLTVTRVRPRTCDATFATGSNPVLLSRVSIGDTVTKAPVTPLVKK